MASTKLFKVNNYHPGLTSLAGGHGILPRQFSPSILHNCDSPPPQPPPFSHQANLSQGRVGSAMTLDYSLPRGRDLETGSPARHRNSPDVGVRGDLETYSKKRDCSDMASRAFSPPNSPDDRGDYLSELATRKNKRKLSSPRRRADIPDEDNNLTAVKKHRHSSYSPASGEDDDSGVDSYKSVDDTILDVVGGGTPRTFSSSTESLDRSEPGVKNFVHSYSEHLSTSATPLASKLSSSPSSSSRNDNLVVPRTSPGKSKKSNRNKKSSARPKSSHERSPSTLSRTNGGDRAERSVPSTSYSTSPPPPSSTETYIPPGIPSNFLHPMLAPTGAPSAAALGLVPGLYYGHHPGLHPSIAMLPPHMQHAYIAAAAAAAQASVLAPQHHPHPAATLSSTAQTSSSSPQPSLSKPETSFRTSALSASPTQESRKKEPSNNSSKTNGSNKGSRGQSHNQRQPAPSSSSSSVSPQPNHHKLSAATSSTGKHNLEEAPSFPHHLLHPSQRSSYTPNCPPAQTAPSTSASTADPPQESLSRPMSPEDLSMGASREDDEGGGGGGGSGSRKHRKNYKNMTRERRVEANARERTRVHTISAAFEALRRAVPSYSHNQKLSKLAILRIACSYIMSLARLGDMDYTTPAEHIGRPMDFSECVDMTTNTIQTEGRARRRH